MVDDAMARAAIQAKPYFMARVTAGEESGGDGATSLIP